MQTNVRAPYFQAPGRIDDRGFLFVFVAHIPPHRRSQSQSKERKGNREMSGGRGGLSQDWRIWRLVGEDSLHQPALIQIQKPDIDHNLAFVSSHYNV